MLTPESTFYRRSRNIVILDLRLVNTGLLSFLQPVLTEFNLQNYEEDVFDYCICKSFQTFLNLTVKGRILNLPKNDLYRAVYDRVEPEFQRAVQYVLSNYRIKFLPGATVKLLSTYEELVIIDYFHN